MKENRDSKYVNKSYIQAIDSDSVSEKDPKDELKRYIKKLQDLKMTGGRSVSYEILLSLKTYIGRLDMDNETSEHLLINMEYLRRQSQQAQVWQFNHETLSEELLRILNEAYDKVINYLEEIVERDIPIRDRPIMRYVQKNKPPSFFDKVKNIGKKQHATSRSIESGSKMTEPLKIADDKDDFLWDMQIFISHKFIREDQELASTLKSILKKNKIFGYLAEKKKEYTLPIDDKIQNSINESQFLIAVITSESLKSASVNQEIGFALGCGVPVALMVEKGLYSEGVFTKGRDVEEFDREQFSMHCESIIKYILGYIEENKNSIRLSKKDKELLIEKVYTPCYDVMKNIYDKRKYLDEIPPNPWESITHTLKFKTEDEMKDLFEKYVQDREKWITLYQNWALDFGNHKKEIEAIVGAAFSSANYLDQHEMIKLPQDRHMGLHEWIHHFKIILFDPSVNDATTLFERLLDFELATTKYQEPFLRYFYEKTDIFRTLSARLKELRSLLTEVPIEETIKQREILKASIEKLTQALQEKLKGN